MPTVSLNISENYVPEWSVWEVAREIICNAKDAGDYWTKEISPDHLQVYTPTSPSTAVLTTIGASGSRDDAAKIGQFGEGAKLAALVATRLGGSLTIWNHEGKCTFSLQQIKGLDERVLHVHTDARHKSSEGCTIDIKLPDVSSVTEGKFVDPSRKLLPKQGDGLRIYNKGVFIMEEQEIHALYDWNLHLDGVNRDRALIDRSRAMFSIGEWLNERNDDIKIYLQVLDNDDCFEEQCIAKNWFVGAEQAELMQEAFREKYGDKSCLASSQMALNQIAMSKGYKIAFKKSHFRRFNIASADEVINYSDTLEEVEVPEGFYREAEQVMELLETGTEVKFFKDYDEAPYGRYENETIFINEKLTRPGGRKDRLATIAHELSHAKSQSSDASLGFEEMLSKYCGLLLTHLM